jgi:hypothetical protein
MIIILVIPSNLLIVMAGIDRINQADPNFIHYGGEVQAYRWMSRFIPEDSLILAARDTGNRLPAFANVRVLYGHPFETPNAEQQEQLVLDLLQWDGDAGEGYERLISLEVDYVFYGQWEMEIGTPTWLSMCSPIYDMKEVRIFQVAAP